uniref:Uncharacterized protein n=1 Tax=Meloidogyne incognita TaxID=6306 RepID=A0A914KUQ2_MELIC
MILNIRSDSSSNNTLRYCHTCNGTVIASCRTIIALLESSQLSPRHGLQLEESIKKMLPAERSSVLKCGKAKPIDYFFDTGIC